MKKNMETKMENGKETATSWKISKNSLKTEMEVSNFDLWNCSWLRIFFENNEPNRFQACTQVRFFCHHRSQVMTESYWQMHACMFFFANISWNYGLYIIETLSVNHKVIVVEQNVR